MIPHIYEVWEHFLLKMMLLIAAYQVNQPTLATVNIKIIVLNKITGPSNLD